MELGYLTKNFLINSEGKFKEGEESVLWLSQLFYMMGASIVLESIKAQKDLQGFTDILFDTEREVTAYFDAIGAKKTFHETFDDAILAVQKPIGGVN